MVLPPLLLLPLGLLVLRAPPSPARSRMGAVVAALDYKDPAVAAEFATVQGYTVEQIEKELEDSGIIAPPTMNEVDLRLMLVELRMRKSGTMPGGGSKKKKPVSSRRCGAIGRARGAVRGVGCRCCTAAEPSSG
eukprot:scaffold238292_cov40-Tisochrysis_lutea.AAC.1